MNNAINPHILEALTLLSVVAFYLMSRATTPQQYRRAWLVQFCAQPFWLASTWLAHQYFMFVVSVIFLLIAMHGVMRFHLIVRDESRRLYAN